jgi:hypothetical protein
MSYIHNEEADFAGSELARMFVADSGLCYSEINVRDRPNFSAFATNEHGNSQWPIADGIISLVKTGTNNGQDDIALEYKRISEGVHGLLTAIGQTLAYLDKGYNGAVMVIPREYSSHNNPAEHVISVLNTNGIDSRVGVFDYTPPNKDYSHPFGGRIRCIRPLNVGAVRQGIVPRTGRPTTQWVHLREGSTTRDVIFGFLKSAVRLSCGGVDQVAFDIPEELVAAVNRTNPNANIAEFLSYTSDDTFNSRVWRDFWFTYVATRDVLTPYIRVNGVYRVQNARTKVLKDDGSGYSQIFEGRVNSLKEFLVSNLNAGEISEDQAWEAMANGYVQTGGQNKQGVRERAHSYREDVDSAVAQLNWIDSGSFPTEEGYKFVALCERFGGANSSAAIEYFGATLIQAGHFGTFLHYVHRLSEEIFTANPLEFTRQERNRPVFNEDSYWEYLERIQDHLSNDLKVMYRVAGRDRNRVRTIFQAELTFLRKYGFLPESRNKRYRLGVGLPINWVKVHDAMQVVL